MSEIKKVIFAPGCFDDFEGTQEELDSLVAEIQRLVDSGEFLDKTTPIDVDDLSEEEFTKLNEAFDQLDSDTPNKRKLN